MVDSRPDVARTAGRPPAALHVIATPIGNLGDLSPRAARLLATVDLLLCEDTRHSGALLERAGARPERWSLNAHNEESRVAAVIERLRGGSAVALISDAGTPCLNDPGGRLVDAVHTAGLPVVAVPGPFAAAVALSGAGLPAVPFTFWGFVAKRSGSRRNQLAERLQAGPSGELMTHAFYVPGRDLRAFCLDVGHVAPSATLAVARELSKVHEGWLRGLPAEVAGAFEDEQLRGEAVILIAVDRQSQASGAELDVDTLLRAGLEQGRERKAALREISQKTGVARRELYRRWLELQGSLK